MASGENEHVSGRWSMALQLQESRWSSGTPTTQWPPPGAQMYTMEEKRLHDCNDNITKLLTDVCSRGNQGLQEVSWPLEALNCMDSKLL